MEDANLGHPSLPIFHSLKKKKKGIHHIFIQHSTEQGERNMAKYNSYKPIFNSNILLNKLKILDRCFYFFLIFVKLDAFSYGPKKKITNLKPHHYKYGN